MIKGICGGSVCKLHPKLQSKKALINLDSPENECFQYALVASIHHTQVSDQCYKSHAYAYKKFLKLYNFTCFTFPVDALELKQFEKLNPTASVTAIVCEKILKNVNKSLQLCYVSHN